MSIQNRMSLLVALMILSAFFWAVMPVGNLGAAESVRVGVFQNKPIVYYDEEGPRGLFIEVMDYVAQMENLDVTYVRCGFKKCMEMIVSNELDVMTSLGHNPKRLETLIFSKEPIWNFWGTVYSRDLRINTIFDLKGKTVGVRRRNKTTSAIRELTAKFKIPVEFVEYDNYETAFDELKNSSLDAVAANNSYTFSELKGKSQFHKTGIVFNPFSAYFAVAKNGGNPELLDMIDRHVKEMRQEKHSLFNRFNERWFGVADPFWTNARVLGTIGGAVLVLFLGMAVWRFRTMARVNRNLRQVIARQEETDARLESSEGRFRNIFENRHSVMLIIEPDCGSIIDANPAAVAFYGWTRQELREMKIDEINILDHENIRCEVAEAKAGERAYFYFRHQLKNGNIRDVEINSGPIEVEGRTVLFSIIHDVTERHRLAKRLKESEIRMIPLFQKAADAIFVSRMDGRLVQVNEQACQSTGYSEPELLTMNVSQVDAQYADSERLGQFISGLEKGKRVTLESKHIRKDGTIFPVEIIINTLDVPGGPFVIGMAKDITARRDAEKEIKEMEARIRRSKKIESIGGRERILLIDDEPSIVKLEAQILERQGYRVTECTDSQAALAEFEKDSKAYDLIITDMTMPGLTGDRLAKAVMDIRPGMPVVICTGFSEKLNRDEAETMGVKDYLMKPVIGSELTNTVRRVLDET